MFRVESEGLAEYSKDPSSDATPTLVDGFTILPERGGASL